MNINKKVLEKIKRFTERNSSISERIEYLHELYDLETKAEENEKEHIRRAVEYMMGIDKNKNTPDAFSVTSALVTTRTGVDKLEIIVNTKRLIYVHIASLTIANNVFSELVKYKILTEEEIPTLDTKFMYYPEESLDANIKGLNFVVGNELICVNIPMDDMFDVFLASIYYKPGNYIKSSMRPPIALRTPIPADSSITEELASLHDTIVMNTFISLLCDGAIKYDKNSTIVTK